MSFLRPPLRRREVKGRYDTSEGFLALRKLPSTRLQRLVLCDNQPLPVEAALPIICEIIVVGLRALSVHSFGVISLLYINLVLESRLAVTPSVIQLSLVTFWDSVEVPTVIILDVVSFLELLLVLLDLVFDS
jgi:hypothetical protein